MNRKIPYFILLFVVLAGNQSLLWADSAQASSQAPSSWEPPRIESQTPALRQGPTSLEPTIERDDVRVSLRTDINKKRQMTVLVKISNLSDHPVLVSPDAVEATTDGGFIIPTVNINSQALEKSSFSGAKGWDTATKITALIPFSTPYQIVTSAQKMAAFTEKTFATPQKPRLGPHGSLREVILQPGMGTHGSIIYDASFMKAYSKAPTIHIKVKADGDEPFEFVFSGR